VLTIDIYYYEGKKDYLNKEIIENLIKTSEEINKVLGEYLDIEFAIKKNEIYILQARPITTIVSTRPTRT
jgi:pyruvate,water dikinase